jgi:hypothetical protein
LTCTPLLRPDVALVQTHQRRGVRSEARFTYTNGRSTNLSPAMHAALGRADGACSFEALGLSADHLPEIRALLAARYITVKELHDDA